MDFVLHLLGRVFLDMDIGSLYMRLVWNTIGLHTAPLGLIPVSWKYRATQFPQQMER